MSSYLSVHVLAKRSYISYFQKERTKASDKKYLYENQYLNIVISIISLVIYVCFIVVVIYIIIYLITRPHKFNHIKLFFTFFTKCFFLLFLSLCLNPCA